MELSQQQIQKLQEVKRNNAILLASSNGKIVVKRKFHNPKKLCIYKERIVENYNTSYYYYTKLNSLKAALKWFDKNMGKLNYKN